MLSHDLLPTALNLETSLGTLRLAPLSESQLDAILDLEKSSHPHPWSRANFVSSLNSSHHCWGLWQEQTLIGHIYLSLAAGEAELLLLVIANNRQGKGLGKLLLNAAIDRLKRHARQFFLEVRASNQAAIALYESIGFNQIGERRNYYPAGNGQKNAENALIYALELDAIEFS